MKDRLIYDKSRHYDIKVNGKKAKIMNYRIVSSSSAPCIILKTKMTNNFSTDWRIEHTLEIPTDSGLLTVVGKICSIASAPAVNEFHYHIISQAVTAKHLRGC